MVTLAPAHPVYAAQEDRYERDKCAEAQAAAYFEEELSHIRRFPIETKEQRKLIAGWDAARAEQNRP